MTTDDTIYLVRHGQTTWNVEGRLQGELDSPLTSRGVEQARAAGRLLKRTLEVGQPVAIESSPSGRALETARLMAAELGMGREAIRTTPLLAERQLGRWAGLTFDEVDQAFPEDDARRAIDEWAHVVPGGESYAMLLERACDWLAQPRPIATTVAVTHGMIGRSIRGAYVGLEPSLIVAGRHPQDRIFRLRAGAIDELIW